jgi:hypothetical protein
MKKNILFIILLMTAQTLSLFAQRSIGGDYDALAKPNIVKINISSLVYKNISLQYERIVGNTISVACGVRFMPSGSLAYTKTIDNLANSNANSDTVQLSDWKANSLTITPEFRFYPKHAGKGFYLAPYFRYRRIGLDLPVNYIDGNNMQQNVAANGRLSSYIGGLMIGSQFNLGSMVTLDWYIIGFQYGATTIKLDVNSSKAMTATEQQDVRTNLQEIKDLSSSFKNINYVVNANGGNISGKYNAVGFRGFGLNLGFKF